MQARQQVHRLARQLRQVQARQQVHQLQRAQVSRPLSLLQQVHQPAQVNQRLNQPQRAQVNQLQSLFHKAQLLARNSYYQILVQKHPNHLYF